jgi:PPOX class probable F420-dependent enzyme
METIGGLAVRRLSALDDGVRALLRAKNFCTVATHGPDGSIRVRVAWVDTAGLHVVLNSVAGRAWVRDIERNPLVNCSVVNLENPYEFASIEGAVVEHTRSGADDHIDFLARKYLDVDVYPFHDPAEPRVVLRILPERILHMAPVAEELD